MRYLPRRLDLAAGTLFVLLVAVSVALLGFHAEDHPAVGSPADPPGNWLGYPGALVAGAVLPTLGYGAAVLLALGFTLAVALFRRASWLSTLGRLVGWAALLPAACVMAEWGRDALSGPTHVGPGGYLGASLSRDLEGLPAGWIVAAVVLLGGQLAWRPLPLWTLRGAASAGRGFLALFWSELWRSRRPTKPASLPEVEQAEPPVRKPTPLPDADRKEAVTSDRPIPIHYHEKPAEAPAAAEADFADHELPPITLLDEGEPFAQDAHDQHLLETAARLEQVFADFGLTVKVVGINTGPVITQYEIALETGMRVSKVTSLTDELALNLSVASVRIVAPIPGKNTVGVEIPNQVREDVRLRDVLAAAGKKAAKMKIPIFLGKDAEGRPLVQDLADMPHLLIAGRTGTGKSVCLNAIILSMLMTRRPDEVRLLLLDPKRTEFTEYGRLALPHLMHPVVVDPKKAEAILGWAIDKMEERYELLAAARVRNVAAYNELAYHDILARVKPRDEEQARKVPKRLPYIVLVIDELADLIMMMRKEVESHIIRLAQKSRAAGIHLILATQRPTVDVITGLIKSNLPSRICFKVVNRSDSRVVLDEGGAEKLLSRGDMLYMPPGSGNLVRAQGAYSSDEEIVRVVEFLDTGVPAYSQELLDLKTREQKEEDENRVASPGTDPGNRDKVYYEAVEVVVREGRGSVSLLQRALGIGYGRAARMIDYMAEDGIVGNYNGSNAREVLVTPEEWAARRERMQQE